MSKQTKNRCGETMPFLKIHGLKVSFRTDAGYVRANDRIDLGIHGNETIGLIGETGCGKSILGHALAGLLPETAEISGKIHYKGKELLTLPRDAMNRIRGREIAMVFQNPSLSLNPVLSVYQQIAEVYRDCLGMAQEKTRQAVAESLTRVEIDPKRMHQYPHQFSGGMLQRVTIAMALAFDPCILIADEITKGLDRPVKQKIIHLLKRVTRGRSMLLITHDLEVARQLCDRIAVMYAGEIVEINDTRTIFDAPGHPYTRGLLNALPKAGMEPIPGHTPSLIAPPRGCRFHPRCGKAREECRTYHPEMRQQGSHSYIRCLTCR
ncbi:ABC transporter ATP-binding protein [Desulfocicer niacini]